MSMPRDPLFRVGLSAHNRLPFAGSAFWYRLRDSVDPVGIEGIPPMTKTLIAGSASGSAYSDPTFYQLPTDNGNTDTVQFVAQENENDLFLDSVLTLQGMVAGEQIIVAQSLAYVEQASTNGYLWTWGSDGNHSQWGFYITTGEVPTLRYRPRNGSGATQTLTAGGGTTFASFKGVGRFSVVMSAHVIDTTHIDVQMLIGNGTLTATYTASNIDVSGGGGASVNPGISGGSSMANFVGLSVGSSGAAGGTNTSFFGRGATNVVKLDQIIGWRGTYDADLMAAVLDSMAVTHKLDFPIPLLRGA